MAAGNFVSYNGHALRLLDGTLDMDSDNIAVALCTSSYTPSASHAAFSDLTNELSHASYTGGSNGGLLLANKAVTQISGKQYKFASDAVQITFASTDATFKYAVFFERNATASSAALIGYVDLNTTGSITVLAGNQLSINCPTNGWFNVTGAT
jgi:hypothetical protein